MIMFWSFEFGAFEFVSDFELRYSDFSTKHFQIPTLKWYLRPPILLEGTYLAANPVNDKPFFL